MKWSVSDRYNRSYTAWGNVAHLTFHSSFGVTALCAVSPRYGDDWFGTGTQNEYEIAAKKRLCKHCARYAGVTDDE